MQEQLRQHAIQCSKEANDAKKEVQDKDLEIQRLTQQLDELTRRHHQQQQQQQGGGAAVATSTSGRDNCGVTMDVGEGGRMQGEGGRMQGEGGNPIVAATPEAAAGAGLVHTQVDALRAGLTERCIQHENHASHMQQLMIDMHNTLRTMQVCGVCLWV